MRTVQASNRFTPREANLVGIWERRARHSRAKACDISQEETGWTADELPGALGDDMPRRNEPRKRGSTLGLLRRSRTAVALGISPKAKSRCASNRTGLGRLASVDSATVDHRCAPASTRSPSMRASAPSWRSAPACAASHSSRPAGSPWAFWERLEGVNLHADLGLEAVNGQRG